ncbi:MAG: hypothetical protein V6Z89_17825 [Desulfobacter sp.]
MGDNTVSELFNVSSRFLRSAHLERDFHDPTGLEGYIFNDYAQKCLTRIAIGLNRDSGQRAWRITGDYGAGKSSFALFLAHWFSGKITKFPTKIQKQSDYNLYTDVIPQFTPILITGYRGPIGEAILHEIDLFLKNKKLPTKLSKSLNRTREKFDEQGIVEDEKLIKLVVDVNKYISDENGYGFLILIDELGKFLEYAALYPENQDIYLLQKLAEIASRSKENPFFIISLLHQGFDAYADQLSQTSQKEWEKIAARFEEIVFSQPIEQETSLIASALNCKVKHLNVYKESTHSAMLETVKLGWFGASPVVSMLVQSAISIFPLHASILPVLIRVLKRFGQNERSLFSFLLSNEPFGLQEFAKKTKLIGDAFYRLDNLYDYIRFNFGHKLTLQSYKSHWNHIESMIESFSTTDELDLKVLKTVGVINLINQNDILATEESIVLALKSFERNKTDILRSINELLKKRRVLYHRGAAGGFCLWPHTSINLDAVLEEAQKVIGKPKRVAGIIKKYIDPSPIVTRRHYIKTGNLRYFSVHYCSVDDFNSTLKKLDVKGDGHIIIPLCETKEERKKALDLTKSVTPEGYYNLLIAIPPYLNVLSGLVQEAQKWEWVARNTPELEADRFAAEEVSKQIDFSRKSLLKKINSFIGLRQFSGGLDLEWYQCGKQLEISSGRQLLKVLSDIVDRVYECAPIIKNELINRAQLSSAAAAARMRLIESLFRSPEKSFLGMNPNKKPPEMAIYLSFLKYAKLHTYEGNIWTIKLPTHNEDKCNVIATLNHIKATIQKNPDEKINVEKIFKELRRPPFGIRNGLLPLFLAVFKQIWDHEVAFYESGSFLPAVQGEEFQRLIKQPESFEIQYCRIEGVRADLYNKLLSTLELSKKTANDPELLDIVQPLCVFIVELPEYVRNTDKLSMNALNVRDTILNTRDPVKLLFWELPEALGLDSFGLKSQISEEKIQNFVHELKRSLDELKMAFPELRDRLKRRIIEAFDISNKRALKYRSHLSDRAEKVAFTVTERSLEAFSLRLFDDLLPEKDWIESVASFLVSKPPDRWTDFDEGTFKQKLIEKTKQFKRIEQIAFDNDSDLKKNIGMRLALTKSNGMEKESVFFISVEEENDMKDLQRNFSELLKSNKNGLVAAYNAIWELMESNNKGNDE